MPAPDDLRMESGQPTPRELYDLALKAMSALSDALAVNRQLVHDKQTTVDHRRNDDTRDPSANAARYRPQNVELREYASFRAYYQQLERVARRDLHLPDDVEVTKDMIYRAGGPARKTTTRIMTRTYGLLADQWPPSTWPEESPAQP